MKRTLLAMFSAVTILGGASLLSAQDGVVYGCPPVPPGCTRTSECVCYPNPTGGTICEDEITCGPVIETRASRR